MPKPTIHKDTKSILESLKNKESLPLRGVKVLEFSNSIAVSMTTMILGDLGATVVRIYRSDRDDTEAPYMGTLDRNKYCIELNLDIPKDLQRARKLIAKSDIVIENFRPGALKKRGIDFHALHKQQPHTIFLSMPGYASNDQERNTWRGTESVVAASSGVYSDMGLNRVLMGINPSFSPLPLASGYGSVLACYTLMSALYHRQKTGCGDVIEIPLASALLETLTYNSVHIKGYPQRYKCQRDLEIEKRLKDGSEMDLSYDDVMDLLDPFFKTYFCKDDRPLYVVCMAHVNHTKRCLTAMGIYDTLVDMGLPDVENVFKPIHEWEAETTIKAYPMRKKWADIIAKKMAVTFRTKTADEWEKILGEAGVPAAKHRTLQEWIHDKHAQDTHLIIKNTDVKHGDMLQPGPVFWSEDIIDKITQPESRRFVNIDDALALFDTPSTLPSHFPQAQDTPAGWLDGIKILDVSNVIAAPHSAYMTSRFGAEIIKVDPVKPKFDPWCSVVYAFNQGRGKRSILIDKDCPKGQEIFKKIVQDVDIVLMNAADRQIAPLGFDEHSLKAINPNIIFCQVDCFGGPKQGERSNYLGYDDLVQATMGIQDRFGGSLKRPEEHAHIGTIDVVCGFSAAASMAMALYARERDNDCKRVHTSLSALGGLLQAQFCYDFDGRPAFDEPRGPDARGYNALSRLYHAQDDWLFLDMERYTHHAERAFPGFIDASDKESFLTDMFKTDTAENWVDTLQNIGIPASVINNIKNLRSTYVRDADATPGIDKGSYSFSTFKDHPSGMDVTMVDPFAIRPKNAKVYFVEPAEKFGASTKHVLLEYGYTESEIDTMLEKGEIGLQWSDEYLPS